MKVKGLETTLQGTKSLGTNIKAKRPTKQNCKEHWGENCHQRNVETVNRLPFGEVI